MPNSKYLLACSTLHWYSFVHIYQNLTSRGILMTYQMLRSAHTSESDSNDISDGEQIQPWGLFANHKLTCARLCILPAALMVAWCPGATLVCTGVILVHWCALVLHWYICAGLQLHWIAFVTFRHYYGPLDLLAAQKLTSVRQGNCWCTDATLVDWYIYTGLQWHWVIFATFRHHCWSPMGWPMSDCAMSLLVHSGILVHWCSLVSPLSTPVYRNAMRWRIILWSG